MTDTNAVSGTSANTSLHTYNANHRPPAEPATTPSTPQFEWTSAKDGVLVSLMAANSSYTHFPRWTQFAMACKNFGLGVPYHLTDDDLLNRCHELKSTLEEWDLVVDARKRPKDEMGYLAYLKGYRSDGPATQIEEGSRSAAQEEGNTNGISEDAAKQGEAASAPHHPSPHNAAEAEAAGSSNAPTQHKHKKQRQALVKEIEAKKRVRKKQSSIVIQGNFDFFNIKKTTRVSKKMVSFKGEGTVNVPF